MKILRYFSLLLGLSACSHAPVDSSRAQYPEAWFAPVRDPNPPAWEILPQAAGPGEVILSKRNELGILSNFAPTPFTFRGHRYASVEGFWQMMLYPEALVDGKRDPRLTLTAATWRHTRDEVAAMASFEAKLAGSSAEKLMARLGIDWVSFEGQKMPYRSLSKGRHYELVRAAMTEKLKQNPEVRRILVATGDLTLRADHHPEKNAPPEWRYFEIWMELREEIRSGRL